MVLSHIAQKLARANSTDRKVVVNVAAEIADKLEPKSGERDPVYNFGWVEGQHRCARALALWRLGRHDEAKAEIYKIISILEQAPQNDWWYEELRDRAKLLATNWDGALLDAVRLAGTSAQPTSRAKRPAHSHSHSYRCSGGSDPLPLAACDQPRPEEDVTSLKRRKGRGKEAIRIRRTIA